MLLAVILFAYQAWRAGSALMDAQSQARSLTSALNAGDLRGAESAALDLRRSTARAHGETDGVLWGIGSKVPWLGRNIGAVQTSADVLDAISAHSLPTLLSLAGEVDHGRLRPRHGRVDLAEIRRLTPSVQRAAAAVDGPAARMAQVDPDGLVYPLNGLVDELRTKVADAHTAIDAAADAFEVLPTMLGADGPRSYLLLVQNNAEIRSTGGMPGSWSVLHARNGKLTMGDQGDAAKFTIGRSPLKLSAEESALFGSQLGLDPRDITMDPDFPTVARIAARLAASHGHRVDGVFAVDPVALSQVLQGTGPVRLANGAVLNAANAVPALLNGVYRTVDSPAAQNDFYASAARQAFDALVAGRGDQVRAIRGLVIAASQHRVLAWSDIPRVARVIGRNKLSGALPTSTGSPEVGVYLNDGGGGKMEYYLRQSATATATSCTDNGTQHLQFSATFRSAATPAVAGYPIWVTGTGAITKPGVMLMSLFVYGPWHGSITSLSVNGRPVTVTGNLHDGHQVGILPVQLRPGQSMTVTGTMVSGPRQPGDVHVTSTPGMETEPDPATFPSACG